jgi:hypothetical protein
MPGYAPAVNVRAQMASTADNAVCELMAHGGVLPEWQVPYQSNRGCNQPAIGWARRLRSNLPLSGQRLRPTLREQRRALEAAGYRRHVSEG